MRAVPVGQRVGDDHVRGIHVLSLASMFMVNTAVPPGVNAEEETDFCIRTSSIVTVCSSVTIEGLVGAVPVKTPVAETLLVIDCSSASSRVEPPLLLSRFEPCSSDAALGRAVPGGGGSPTGDARDVFWISSLHQRPGSPTFHVTAVYTPVRFPSPGTPLRAVHGLDADRQRAWVGLTGGTPESGPEPGTPRSPPAKVVHVAAAEELQLRQAKVGECDVVRGNRLLLRIVSVYVERWSDPRSNSSSLRAVGVLLLTTTNGAVSCPRCRYWRRPRVGDRRTVVVELRHLRS